MVSFRERAGSSEGGNSSDDGIALPDPPGESPNKKNGNSNTSIFPFNFLNPFAEDSEPEKDMAATVVKLEVANQLKTLSLDFKTLISIKLFIEFSEICQRAATDNL